MGRIFRSEGSGALLLAKAGLLDGLEATTHRGAIDLLREVAPKTIVHADRRVVDNGRVALSAGIAAGIDTALHVAARLLGEEHARKTAQYMEYPRPPPSSVGPGRVWGPPPAKFPLRIIPPVG